MAGFSQRQGFVALLLGVLFFLLAAWFYLWALSSASLRCVECNCYYDLSAANSDCRLPAILSLLFFGTVAVAVGLVVLAWFQRRRAKRIKALD
jgi:ABC-type antimicrobial peptide transport system permease subunit